jgi:hypothetical protein
MRSRRRWLVPSQPSAVDGRGRRRLRIAIVVGTVLGLTSGGLLGSASSANATNSTPQVSSISPASSPTSMIDPGAKLTISGSGFTGASQVLFGSAPATGYQVIDDNTIAAIAPNHVSGTVDLTVTAPGGTSATGPATKVTFYPEIGVISRDAYPDPAAYSNSSNVGAPASYENWMSDPRYMPDDRRLSQMSLPGTHDTGTWDTSFAPAQTQSMDFTTQLNSGIRAFDLRIGQRNPNDPTASCNKKPFIFHGTLFCLEALDSTLQQIGDWLHTHQNEFVVARYGDAGSPTDSNHVPGDACQTLDQVLAANNHLVYDGGSQNPTARDMRGKLVILNDFGQDGGFVSGTQQWCKFSSFATPISYSSLNVQDDYDMSALSDRAAMHQKWVTDAQAQFDATDNAAQSSNTVYMNYLSATGFSVDNLINASTPCFYASGAHDCTLPGGYVLSDHGPLTGGLDPMHYGELNYIQQNLATDCEIDFSCNEMVWHGLYQMTDCSPVTGGTVCTPVYVGMNAMAEAYISGSDRSGSTDIANPSTARRSPQFSGISRAGIVMTDLPGKNLIGAIIAANANAVTEFATRPPDHNGWYTAPVDVAVSCGGRYYDNDPHNASKGCPRDQYGNPAVVQTLSRNGTNVAAFPYNVEDGFGQEMKSNAATFQIDRVGPRIQAFSPNPIDVNASTPTGTPVTFNDWIPQGGVWQGYTITLPGQTIYINIDDNISGVASSSCDLQNVPDWQKGVAYALPTGTTTVACSAVNYAGLRTDLTIPIRVHATITAAAAQTPNAAGWYHQQPITVQFTCSGTGVGSPCPADQVFTQEGQFSSSAQITSTDGTLTETSNAVPVNIDVHAPTIDTSTFAVDATAPTGARVNLSSIATDGVSGVKTLTCTPASLSTFKIGDTPTTCAAQDVAGNTTGNTPLTVHVRNAAEQAGVLATNAGLAPAGDNLTSSANLVVTDLGKNMKPQACTALLTLSTAVLNATDLGSLGGTLITEIGDLTGTLGGCVYQGPTNTALTYSPASPVTGQPVTLTATVTNSAGGPVALGTVQFVVDGASLGAPVTVSKTGVATKTTSFSPLVGGSGVIPHSVVAQYVGSAKSLASTSAVSSVNVASAGTTTTIDSSPQQPTLGGGVDLVYGQPLTLKAAVAATAPGTGIPTGTVVFSDFYGATLPSAQLSNGKASVRLSSPLSAGHHALTAEYVGNVQYNMSFSDDPVHPLLWVLVAKANTTTALTVPSSTFGNPVTLTASVKPTAVSNPVPTGTVTFSSSSGPLAPPVAVDVNGIASLQLTNVPVGTRTITAAYSGSDNYNTSTAPTKTESVTNPTMTTLTATPNPVASGGSVTLTASVTAADKHVPPGAVAFSDGSTVLKTVRMTNGQASTTVTLTAAGTHPITAAYLGAPPLPGTESFSVSSGNVDVVVGSSANSNDAFAYASTLPGSVGSRTGTNVGATAEAGEPAAESYSGPNNTVWYRWTAPASGPAEVDTCTNTNFDTMLGVYTGTAVNALTTVATNDDSCGSQSKVTFTATAKTTYMVQVDGYKGAAGPFTLSWSLQTPPSNDNFANAASISGASGSMNGANANATVQSGEPAASSAGPWSTVWYKWVAPASATAEFDTCANPNTDTVLGVYTGTALSSLTPVASNNDSCGPQSQVFFSAIAGTTYYIQVDGWSAAQGTFTLTWTTAANDNFANATTLPGSTASGSISGFNTGATAEPGEPKAVSYSGPNNTVWYQWTAPTSGTAVFDTCTNTQFDTMLAAYTGSAVNALVQLASNDNTCGRQSSIEFAATIGQTYSIQVDGRNGATGTFTLSWALYPPVPNDNFADATSLSGASGMQLGYTFGATVEAGEPSYAGGCQFCSGPNNTVWYKWTAGVAGTASFDTCTSSGLYSTIGVYSGDQLQSLQFVNQGGNPSDCAGGNGSRVNFHAVGGATYYIQVDGIYDSGAFTLSWSLNPAPPNDDFANATVLSGASGSVNGTNVNATAEYQEPTGMFGNFQTVWYAWTPTSSSTATFDTCTNTTYDTGLTVYKGAGLTSLQFVNGNDNACGSGQSRVSFFATAGVTYYIQFDGWQDLQGPFTLSWAS